MCGLYGCTGKDIKLVKRMMELSLNRGPDNSGIEANRYVTIGHNLLSITDSPDNSRQPWVTREIILAFNGELYNTQELKEYIGAGYRFKTTTDTEILAKGLEIYGMKFLEYVDGMFAIACYFKRDKRLCLARDYVGARPLYYTFRSDNRIYFSSSIASLLETGIDRKLDMIGFEVYKYFGYIPGPRTLIKNLRKLVPGQIIEYDILNGVSYKSSINNTLITEPSYSEEQARYVITDSVNKCLTGKRDYGLLLSGGMDSTILARELRGKSIKTFTTRFKGNDRLLQQDCNVARQISRIYKFIHHELQIDFDAFLNHVEKTVSVLEFPNHNRNNPAYYLLNKLISEQDITIVLSGIGGDEIFTGYLKHLRIVDGSVDDWIRLNRLSYNVNIKLPEAARDYLNTHLKPLDFHDIVNNFLYLDCITNLAEEFLTTADKLGMHFMMETRFPLLSKQCLKYFLNVPSKYKLTDQTAKKITRNLYENLLPECVTKKPKTGWSIPYKDWLFTNKFRAFSSKILSPNYYQPTHMFIPLFATQHPKSIPVFTNFQIWAKEFKITL